MSGSLLRSGHTATPRPQLGQPIDLLIGDPTEHRGQPGLRVDAVPFYGFEQGEGQGFGAAFGTGERPVFRPMSNGFTASSAELLSSFREPLSR
jgi:hypothetical protein